MWTVRGAAAAAICAAFALPPAATAQLPGLPPLPSPAPPDERPPPSDPPKPPGPVSQAPGSVTEGVDVAQSGFFADEKLVPPLVRRWSVELEASFVLAANGRVFVVRRDGVAALDQADGREVWSAPLQGASAAGFDAGTLFVSAGVNGLHAFEADTGQKRWGRTLEQNANPGPPVASGGAVYAYAGASIHAFQASNGEPLWKAFAYNGGRAPAIDSGRVYVGSACGNARALDRVSGATAWDHKTTCDGGGSVTPGLHGGRLYVPESERNGDVISDPPIFDAGNGGVVGRFQGRRPVFVDGRAIFGDLGRGLRATDLSTGREAWRSKDYLGGLTAVGHDLYGVFTPDPGEVGQPHARALDAETGELLWSQQLDAGRVECSGCGTVPQLAVAPGLLIVSSQGRLTAFESAFRPEAGSIDVGSSGPEVTAGRSLYVGGVLGENLRKDRPTVEIQLGGWPKGAFRRAASVRASRDGGFHRKLRITRNVRFRAVSAGARSKPLSLYAWPSASLGRPIALSRTRTRISLAVRAPGVSLSGRTLVLYMQRRKSKTLTRLGSCRLSGGRRARVTIAYREPRKFDTKDYYWWCVKGQLALDLGRPSEFLRRCGAARVATPG